ncbi:Cytochrome b-c1 complex subunit Rieske, mitochondrial [Vanrija albida]|uniref:Cytochrome b-c1 complex subunit Rieske, mitochondrial n=1 Tax=Vanrija albida TaxID=181172 RepID=A0ABR3QEW6_9TREE
MALTRINLAPSVRTLASGVPAARVAFNLPAAHHAEHHDASGPRADAPAKFASRFANGVSGIRTSAAPTGIFTARRMHTSTKALAGKHSNGVPDFSAYKTSNEGANKNVSYFMVGALGALAASGAKSTVTDILSNMAASADVLALAKIEVEMGAIPEGKNLIVKWRGKPIFIRHRTPDEIEEARSVDVKSLRDPETDEQRTQRPEWLVMVGVCTHLGCVPIGEAGDYGGWFCPCHGSHYDISGRIRKGPAPLNLEIPEYAFDDDSEKIVVG